MPKTRKGQKRDKRNSQSKRASNRIHKSRKELEMTTPITHAPTYAAVDLDVLQESALAVAQSTIQNAMNEAGLKPIDLAKKLGWHRSFVSRMMSGRQNLTIKTFALALAGCGFRAQFGYSPLV